MEKTHFSSSVGGQTRLAYDYIRERILSGIFLPGTPLTGLRLAQDLNSSRAPIQAALARLELEGLVKYTPHLGAEVRSMSREELIDLGWMRCSLEELAARQAAERRTDEDVVLIRLRLEQIQEATEELARNPSNKEIRKNVILKDAAFHEQIIKASYNIPLIETLQHCHVVQRVMLGGMDEKMLPTKRIPPGEVSVLHGRIYEAIQLKQPDLAGKAMHEHLARSLKVMD